MIEHLDPHITPQLAQSALLVIDTQVDFVDGGTFPIPGTTRVLPAITRLLHTYRAAGLPIVHVVRLYDGDDVDLARRTSIARGAPIARPGTDGSQIVAELRPEGATPLDPEMLMDGRCQELAEQEWAMWKPRWGAFHRTPLDRHLRHLGVTTVVIAGCNYPNCPRAAVYGASERDYRVLIVSDAISGAASHHLEEASLMGVVSAPSSDVTEYLAARCRASRKG
ncbi:MAG: cysteine hydrolase family protein [Pseudonocardiaceae bacterium]